MATITVVKDRTTIEAGASGKTWIERTLINRTIEVKDGKITLGDGRVQRFGPGVMHMRSYG